MQYKICWLMSVMGESSETKKNICSFLLHENFLLLRLSVKLVVFCQQIQFSLNYSFCDMCFVICFFFISFICYVLVCFPLPKDSLGEDEKAVLQLRSQQAFAGDDRQGSILCNPRWRRARHEGRRPGWKLGPLCQVPTAWEMLRSVSRGSSSATS